jgi:hypothetical protein
MALIYPYQHVLRRDRMGRQGQRCEILRAAGTKVQIRFEDGVTGILDRTDLRRLSEAEIKKLDEARDKSTLAAKHLPCTGE